MNWRKSIAALALSSVVTMVSIRAHAADPSAPGNVISAHTEPSKMLSMSFPSAGIIKQVPVKEGDIVKSGQILLEQDDEIEKQELDRLKLEADSLARLEYAQADLAVKIKVFERKSKAEGGVFSQEEIEEAQLDKVHSEKQIDVVNLDRQDNISKAKQQETKIAKMQLRSPIDGVVQSIKTWEGEMAAPDPDKAVIIVVRNDPCYVVIPLLKTSQVALLSLGETMDVKYPDETDWQQAKIIFISPVAKAESDTQLIKLELPNPQNKATGLPIQVKLPPKLVENSADRTALR